MKKINQGKQMRNVWGISATLPIKRIILASTKQGDLVLDPFCGSSTTRVAAILLNRKYVGIDLEDEYLYLSKKRIEEVIKKPSAFLKHEERQVYA